MQGTLGPHPSTALLGEAQDLFILSLSGFSAPG
eukprot:CAMPEP_0177358062 /NCGR_PEP_ID=MMETSP0368-20130122/35387_1 /TAXON_ID=447022 ORGANISM="Scrippsiella hangoei-like, Strain SHHI-4" /NCGR_SAMPLE_ID=MMETSP0368 /ASSEMBLY_ACC=CAM_ASM_000363 /LENGTH=32 /DNA_ID= /DNA_START= /DNA_END= /DNA_ORIENTATION=